MDVGTISYRLRWRQLPWWMPLLPVGGALNAVSDHPEFGPTPWWLRAFPVVLLVVIVGEMCWLRTTGVDLRPDALVMRGIRRRVLPWRDITWIGPAPLMGTQSIGVSTQRDGVRRLRAPQHTPFLGPDKEFLAKANVIYDYWVAHRGPDWEPPRPYWADPATAAGSAP